MGLNLAGPFVGHDGAVYFILVLLAAASVPLGASLTGQGSVHESVAPAASLCAQSLVSPSPSVRIAIVRPVFTVAAYSQSPHQSHSFYDFYAKYLNASGFIKKDLGWLVARNLSGLTRGGGWADDSGLLELFNSTSASLCAQGIAPYVVSDVDVDGGVLFSRRARAFDTAILGHAEYATQREYDQLREFVTSGGRLLLTSGDALEVKVNYTSSTGIETYVVGHGFAFNGTVAWASHELPFDRNNTDWVGSVYLSGALPMPPVIDNENGKVSHVGVPSLGAGARLNVSNMIGRRLYQLYGPIVFRKYIHHEEDVLTNLTATSIIATFRNSSRLLVASYLHRYIQGTVVCLCVYGEQLVGEPAFTSFVIMAATVPLNGHG